MTLSQRVHPIAVFTILLLFGSPSGAQAGEEPQATGSESVTGQRAPEWLSNVLAESVEPGVYFQVGLVVANSFIDDVDDSARLGVNVTMGARLGRNLAIEADFEGIYGWDTPHQRTNTYAFMASVKGYEAFGPLGPIRSLHPFVIGGVGALISERDSREVARFAYRLGLGLDAYVHDAIYVSFSYSYTGNLDDFGYGSFLSAVGYRFD
jgi:opacity protein-like surface antigen